MGDFSQKIILTLIDKLAIGLLIIGVVYYFNRLLEKYKSEQSKLLELLRGEQALRKEYETLRDQTAVKHLQRQIEELYSPLFGLIQYGDVVNKVERLKIPENSQSKEAGEILFYFREKYYLPLNAQMSDLIRTKIYLLDSEIMPESFQQFLMHSAQFQCFHSLWIDKGISSDDIPPIEYPKTFKQDVKNSLDQLMSSYNEYIRRLKAVT
jgi:hypothetical protein